MQPPSITLTNDWHQNAAPSLASSASTSTAGGDASSSAHSRFDRDSMAATSAPAIAHNTWSHASDSAPLVATMFDGRLRRKTRANNASFPASTAPGIPDVVREVVREHEIQPQHAIDPLSSHIIKRTSVSPLAPPISPRRPSPSETTLSMRTDDARSTRSRSRSRQRSEVSSNARNDLKKGVKAVAFLTRIMGTKKQEPAAEVSDKASNSSDAHVEGNEAEVFAQPADAAESRIRSTQSPNYIKVRSRYKERQEFGHLFLAQEMQCTNRKLVRTDSNKLRRKSSATSDSDTIWAMQFSRDGMHLAAAGADTVVRVWKVLSSVEDRKAHERQESSGTSDDSHLSAPVFQSQTIREYQGHEAPVLDLSWSKNNFLISSSMDKTVRLWHLSRPGCLCTFRHNDFVTSITFHPKDDRFFLAGSLDSKLRLWNISDKTVAFSISVPDMITAVSFMPDGKLAVAGTLNGSCYWYETEGLKYKTQLQIRPDKGQGVSGPKVTAIQTAQGRGGDKVLITSNDSKIRLYNMRDQGCEMVFKGNVNDSSQIRGSLSDDGRYVVCGSEDRKAYIWSVTPAESGKLDKKPVEYFDAHDSITTCVCIAPVKSRRLLAQSEDPIYDASNLDDYALARTESHGSSRPATEAVQEGESPPLQRTNSMRAPSLYKDGNIIVTADYAGKIKVFRQDCALHKRRADDGDRASIFKRSSMASSLQTRSSQKSLRDAKNMAMSQVASTDRIMSWRQGIAMTPATRQVSPKEQTRSSRESSPNEPRKSQEGTATSAGSPSTNPTSMSSADQPTMAINDSVAAAEDVFRSEHKDKEELPSRDGHRSYEYWDRAIGFSHLVASKMHQEGQRAPMARTISRVSQLSDERALAESDSENEQFDDAVERHDGVV